jgi:thioredoxin-related protein
MKTAFRHLLPLALSFLVSAYALADGWTVHYADAMTKAQTDNKAVLLNFTGSDWCPWCQKMKQEILDTGAFRQYADDNLELVTLDFPNAVPQPPSIKTQNKQLQKKYKVDGFPTFILLSSDGRVLWKQVGYLAGGPQAFIGEIQKRYHHTGAASTSSGGGDDFDSFFKKPAQSPTP